MKTDGYNGIRGLVLARAENHPDRWAVAPIHKKHKKTVAALKHERPLAIKDSSLVVVDASEDEDSEPSDLDETSWVSRATALPPAAALRGVV